MAICGRDPMSWTDYFPVLGDDLVAIYQSDAGLAERAEIRAHFAVREWLNRRPAAHLVSASLFWKPATACERGFPPLSREVLKNPGKSGIRSRVSDPWQHYVEPLLAGARNLRERRPDVVFRVYLAADLEFLIDDLTDAGCEIALMEGGSVLHNPGAMWRFLAMEGPETVTVIDADRAPQVVHDVIRTEATAAAGLGSWRSPYTWGAAASQPNMAAWYRPVNACQFGSALDLPMTALVEAFLWAVGTGRISTWAPAAFGGPEAFFGSRWPGYGFDEWFLSCAVFPRLAAGGILTVIRPADHSLHHLFALDIEYCTWANRSSEILYLPKDEVRGEPQLP